MTSQTRPSPAGAAVAANTQPLRTAVTAQGVGTHLDALQAIASANGGTRASGTPGYTASADYVDRTLAAAGYVVTRQPFTFRTFSETADATFQRTAPTTRTYDADDFATMEYSGSGSVTAPVQAVDLVLPPGATASTSTRVRGVRLRRLRRRPGRAAPARDVRLRRQGRERRERRCVRRHHLQRGPGSRTEVLTGTLGNTADVRIPVIGTSFEVGNELAALPGATVSVSTTTLISTVQTENVIAQTPTGRTDRVVLVGAHLDSVLEGPGINGNGSGTATTLEVALQMGKLGIQPVNAVRFAFWGAEESGLVGSQFYVDSLTKAQTKDIMLNLNFDMLGSTNFARFIYDGDGGAFGSTGPSGSARIEQVFEQYFASQGLATEPTEFDGRSDYDAFIAAGIPAGGLFTGAEGLKTAAQVALYGGTAGEQYDPCHHEACDDRSNISPVAIDQMSDAVAHAVLTFAMSTSSPNGTARSAGTHGEHKGNALRK
jgi:hypothetical protein